MRLLKHILVILSAFVTITVAAQNSRPPQVKKTVGKAQIVMDGNQECLVLKTGRKSKNYNASFYPDDIMLQLDEHTYRLLDDLLISPFGRNVTVKDVHGFNVQIARARVFEKNGLIFVRGTCNVPVMQDEWNALKMVSVLWQRPPR
jgi:hypothetical protein